MENLLGLSELGNRLRALGIRSTYFITHSVAVSGRLESMLETDLTAKSCEVGTHFHPGDTPPFPNSMPSSDNIIRIPTFLLEEKFANLHAAISSRFGAPKSYRSGAWAIDSRILALLARYRYRVDSSVTPGISWRVNGRPSYLTAPMHAYSLGSEDPNIPGIKTKDGVMEIPVSILSPRKWDDTKMSRVIGKIAGSVLTMPLAARDSVAVRTIRALRPSPPQWLRPAFMQTSELERTALQLEKEGAEYLHVMCHSNELWPGASPYCRNRDDLKNLYTRIETFFRFALARGYQPVTLFEYAQASTPIPPEGE